MEARSVGRLCFNDLVTCDFSGTRDSPFRSDNLRLGNATSHATGTKMRGLATGTAVKFIISCRGAEGMTLQKWRHLPEGPEFVEMFRHDFTSMQVID